MIKMTRTKKDKKKMEKKEKKKQHISTRNMVLIKI